MIRDHRRWFAAGLGGLVLLGGAPAVAVPSSAPVRIVAHLRTHHRIDYDDGVMTYWITTNAADPDQVLAGHTLELQYRRSGAWKVEDSVTTTSDQSGVSLSFSDVATADWRAVLLADDSTARDVSATKNVEVRRATALETDNRTERSIAYREPLVLQDRVTWAVNGDWDAGPAPHQDVVLEASVRGGAWHRTGRQSTGHDGRVSFTRHPRFDTRYRFVHPIQVGRYTTLPSQSRIFHVSVGAHLAAHIRSHGRVDRPIAFHGRLRPAVAGHTILVIGEHGRTKVTTDSHGRFSGGLTLHRAGVERVIFQVARNRDNGSIGRGPMFQVTIR